MTAELQPRARCGQNTLAGKYLTFTLQRESYGIRVLQVREIIRLTDITAVPQMPAYIRGVINLRGKIIPVLDLRMRFGFPDTGHTEQTCIVVVQVTLPDGKGTAMGIVVDGVEEVLNIAESEIEETPDFGVQLNTDYILGMAKIKGSVKALLDLDKVIASDAAIAVQRVSVAAAASQTAGQAIRPPEPGCDPAVSPHLSRS